MEMAFPRLKLLMVDHSLPSKTINIVLRLHPRIAVNNNILLRETLNLVTLTGVANNENLPARDFVSTFREGSEFTDSVLHIPEHASQVISEDSMFSSMGFSRMNPEAQILEQKQWQPYLSHEQFNKPFHLDEPMYYLAQQGEFSSPIAGQAVSMHSQLPSEQLHGIHVASESFSLLSNSKEIAGPKHDSFECKILHAYSSHKNSAMPTGDCLVSFVNYLHSTFCKDRSCKCRHFCALLSHFDKCCYANCDICGPLRDHPLTHNHHQNGSFLGDSSKTNTGGSGSCSSENMLPPTKRFKPSSYCSENSLPFSGHLKVNKSSSLLSSDKRTSVLAPLTVQPSDPEGLLPLLQWPESPVSINSEVLEGNTEFSTRPMQSPSRFYQKGNSAGEQFLSPNAESLCRPSKELIVAPKSEEIDSRSFGGTVDSVRDKADQLRVNSMPALFEEPGTSSKEEVIQIASNCDLAKPDLEAEMNEEMKAENPKTRGVSLIEFFSADEIKDHISSLRQWIGQRISKEEKEEQEIHCANENTCQLCAADKLLLAPVPIYCSSCGSRIKRSVIYYNASEENGTRHSFCTLCYKARGASITFYGITIPKAKLDKKKNDEEIEEPWVQCDKCKSWQHQICALFNDKRDMEGESEYICPKCCLEEIRRWGHMPLPKSTVLGAKDLPSTLLSDFIEQRLFRRLQQEKEDKAKVIGKNIDEVPGAENLVVRVVLSVKKQLKVKKQFLEIFRDGNYPDEFSYSSKVILLFQKIEGVDVCLFGMYVQEFGSECSQPNHRCVYISYLDSVKYFRPERQTATGEALRTFVYHEILIGYLEYCKKQGFAACYLWACPPLKGEDYILYSHPAIQKTPKSDKLRQWYNSMLRKAAKENVVVNVTNLYDHLFVPSGQFHSKVTAARLPYFDGDYWSGAAETIINNIEQQNGKSSGRKIKKSMTKRTLKAMGHTNPSDDITKEVLLMQKLGQTIFPVKEDFFVLHLQFVCTSCHEVISYGQRWFCSQCKNFQLCERCHDLEHSLNGGDTHAISSKEKHLLSKIMVDDIPSDTKDEDVILDSWLFENRHTLLGFCQKNHHQFDTLRRAKHSSMMILHHLHNPIMSTTATTCNICQQDINAEDRNVCATCRNKKFGLFRIHKLAYQSSAANCETENRDAWRGLLKLKELLYVLQHASQCRTTNGEPCSYPNCLLVRRLLYHASNCTIRIRRGCPGCIKAWKILWIHAKFCRQADCCVPRCRDLKSHMHAL
ncbi:histone acetyltransferase HAC12-like isoform X2 [Ricinus communis]|uniref:histone acetyltransferase HAC12-like isoform X2 n=1 Tax=Ricinus communis TaxID=3988 RepID=UPI00201A4DA5|nr:histone acetyltransferase HAC12-like isoform X2 [Ricinus communis]